MSLQNLIKYYNLCYQADNKGMLIKNIFSTSSENKYFLEDIDEELITGYLHYYPLEWNYAQETSKKITLNSKEKELVYASTFIVGYDENSIGNSKRVCSPLFTFPAEIIETDNEYNLKIDTENFRVNYQIFNEIKVIEGDTSSFYSKLFDAVNKKIITEEIISNVITIIDNNTSNIDTSELLMFPRLKTANQIKNIFNRKAVKQERKFYIVPGACLTIVKKSVNTRGIINELEELSSTVKLSEPLQTIFTEKKFEKSSRNGTNGYTPAILSKAQADIINNSAKFPFTTIVGPPGTGKTYTISALAIEKMSRQKSVLIVSKTDKAVDIIAEKIEKQLNLKQIVIRAGRSNYKKELIQHLKHLLSIYDTNIDNLKSEQLLKELHQLDKEIKKAEKYFKRRVKNELKWSKQLDKPKGFFQNIHNDIIHWRNSILEEHFDIIQRFYQALQQHNTLIVNYIKAKHHEDIMLMLQESRGSIKLLLKALKSRLGSEQAFLFKNIYFKKILKVFPIWLVKMSDIYKALPMQCEMFDYVIIDEATQCDIASSIPCLQRGKHAIITGDPNQLRHFSFLSKVQQNIFAEKLDLNDNYSPYLDYKNNSILDMVTENSISNEQFVFLDEHFRSLPAIINFSNRNIYQSKLKIMTSRPYLPLNKGIILRKTSGVRLKQGYNKEEAETVIEILQNIIAREKNITKTICSSIGILSPFRDQVEYLQECITQKFTLGDLEKHNINIETPYGFQGDERDIMILSFALDNNSNATAFRYADKKEVFNVAITRACKEQYLVYSIDTKTLKINSLLRQYIESFELVAESQIENNNNQIKNKFAQEVKSELESKGFSVNISYEVAGTLLDIIASKNNKSYGIDLIGFTDDAFGDAFSLEKYKILSRAGLPLYPFAYTYWKKDKDMLLQKFMECVEK